MTAAASVTTRDKIKLAGQELIATHGVDGVAVRDIVKAAGQKNMASLYYYFRTKDDLIKELIVDASELMEGRRAEGLALLLASQPDPTVRDLVEIIVSGATLNLAEGGRNANVLRFLGAVLATHRSLFDDAIGSRYNVTYQRCLDLLRRALPDIPTSILNQRLLLMSISSINLLIAREAGIAAGGHAAKYWGGAGTSYNLIDFLCGGLTAPVCADLTRGVTVDIAHRHHMVRHFGVIAS